MIEEAYWAAVGGWITLSLVVLAYFTKLMIKARREEGTDDQESSLIDSRRRNTVVGFIVVVLCVLGVAVTVYAFPIGYRFDVLLRTGIVCFLSCVMVVSSVVTVRRNEDLTYRQMNIRKRREDSARIIKAWEEGDK